MKQSEVDNLSEFVKVAHDMLHNKKGPGSDYLGWVTLPYDYDKEEFSRIKKAAERIQKSFGRINRDWNWGFLFRGKSSD